MFFHIYDCIFASYFYYEIPNDLCYENQALIIDISKYSWHIIMSIITIITKIAISISTFNNISY